MFDRQKAYEDLKKTYDEYMATAVSRSSNCPPKAVTVIKRNEAGLVTRFENVMGAKTGFGHFGDRVFKTIELDDETGYSKEVVKYYDGASKRVSELKDRGITPVRCGLMTCLAVERLMCEKPKKIGYIGNGRINLENCKAITEFIGEHDAVIRGSKNDRAKNKARFESLCKTVVVDDTERLERLSECDVVISCTTTCDPSDVIENALLSNVPLVVALDSGYVFGESFRRERVLYTDHPEQLIAHYAEEFPYDSKVYPHTCLTEAKAERNVAVHLFGVAIADLVVAKHYVRGGCEW